MTVLGALPLILGTWLVAFIVAATSPLPKSNVLAYAHLVAILSVGSSGSIVAVVLS